MSEPTRLCRDTCGRTLSLDHFGRNRYYADGKHIYCKDCCRLKARTFRSDLNDVDRKGNIVRGNARVGTVRQRVKSAIISGAHSRVEIKKATRLDWDDLTECLAELTLEHRVLFTRVVGDDRQFFLRRAA